MTYGQLRDYITRLNASGANVVPQRVALARKIAFPFVTVIMTILAVPFAVTTGRHGAMYGVGIGIVLAITYIVALSVSGALGAGGVLPPAARRVGAEYPLRRRRHLHGADGRT